MSAPDTNVDKQAKKHKTPLVGIAAVVIYAGALLLGLMFWLSANGNEPGEADEGVTTETPEATIDG